MNTTVKGLVPGETIKVFHLAKAQPFLHYRQQPPGAGIATGVVDANGNLTLDLPSWTPMAWVRSNGTAIVVENATTVVTSP